MKKNRALAVSLSILLLGSGPALSAAQGSTILSSTDFVPKAVQQDVSAPLRTMAAQSAPTAHKLTERPLRLFPRQSAIRQDNAIQSSATAAPIVTANGLSFPGVGNGDYGFSDRYAPPDTVGAVGATQYVQWVNTDFAIFNKNTGALVLGPTPGNAIWTGFTGACETNNDGDPIVQYDKLANRWVMTQFSVSTTPYLQCVAVSVTSDATGSWNRYAFSYGNTMFNDYPKLGIWPDGYYITYNIFSGNSFTGSLVCAFDRTSMLLGNAATQQCFLTSNSYGGLLPSDLDGTTPPPAGSPNYIMGFENNVLQLWKFHVDWVNPVNSTLGTGSVSGNMGTAGSPTLIPVTSFAVACSGGGACIPQPGTSQKLDSLADRLMYRLSYRNFGAYGSLLVNHSVTANSVTAIRWYELRVASSSANPTVYQQSTYQPTSDSRWMGSIAQDKVGNIAIGYNLSSGSIYPSIYVAARAPLDTLNTLGTETLLKAGGGSQLRTLTRWGDYSAMTVDPIDDCTFWFTTEYLKSSGTFNWSTWISSFKLPGCSSTPQTISSIVVSPASSTINTGSTQQFNAVAYDSLGGVLTTQPTFAWTVASGLGSVSSSGLYTAAGTAGSAVVNASSGGVTGTANISVVSVQTGSILLTSSPSSLTLTRNSTSSSITLNIARTNNSSPVSLSASTPPGVKVNFSSNSVISNSTSFTVTVSKAAKVGTYAIRITGTTTSPSSSNTLSIPLVIR